jgi:hypothetical protein
MMSVTKALITKDATYDRISQIKNQMKKPHMKTDDAVINMLIDNWENRSSILQEEIEEDEIVIRFPSTNLIP